MNRDIAPMNVNLHGKTALVTGGLGIIGRRLCAGLAVNGAKVAVIDLDGAAAKRLAAELTVQFGCECLGIACNVARPEEVAEMADRAADKWGGIDILFNNAASKSNNLQQFFAPFETYTLEQWRQIMDVNVDGMFLVAQSVGNRMIDQGRGGSIVQTSSIYGMLAPDDRIYAGAQYMGTAINTPAVYSVSKAAVLGLTQYLAARWAKHGIRVNTLTPGGMQSGQNDEFVANYSRRVPMARMGRPEELVGAALFLASDASSYMTGHNLIVDGGLHIW